MKRSVPTHFEVMDEAIAAMLRDKTGVERLAIADSLYSSARKMLICHLTTCHPDWTEDQILREAARRLSHGAV